ncbi:MAG: hypothetical protein JWM21_907 [Acidobacteria bacterium]|nr:hypothetical protein [Acidobacteriota bacterium]
MVRDEFDVISDFWIVSRIPPLILGPTGSRQNYLASLR